MLFFPKYTAFLIDLDSKIGYNASILISAIKFDVWDTLDERSPTVSPIQNDLGR